MAHGLSHTGHRLQWFGPMAQAQKASILQATRTCERVQKHNVYYITAFIGLIISYCNVSPALWAGPFGPGPNGWALWAGPKGPDPLGPAQTANAYWQSPT